MIDLTLLGCGGGMPLPGRFLSALCIKYKGRKILVDCGEGTQVSMRMCNLGFKTVDAICVSHVHGDHLIGLPGILSTIGNSGRVNPLIIIGPEGIEEVVKGLMVLNKFLPYEVKIIENPKEEIEMFDGNMIINCLNVDHTRPCLGYSFYLKRKPVFDVKKAEENGVPKSLWSILQKLSSSEPILYNEKYYSKEMVMGKSRQGIKISFITDTRPTEKMPEFIKDSDLFICEGTYGDDNDIEKALKNKHMTFREAGKIAKSGNVSELLLTHYSSAMSEPEKYLINAKSEFDKVILGSDRMEIALKYK